MSDGSQTIFLGRNAKLDLGVLAKTRAVVQGSSRSGKSYLLRKLAEEVVSVMQVIVLDWAGEFETLRERYPFLLVSDDGDVRIDESTALRTAREVYARRISTIVDLSSMKAGDRRSYVRTFLNALLSVPREGRHPVLVLVDEAHKLAPERSVGVKSEAVEAVADLMSQGAKYGLIGVVATQRLSKIQKDTIAEAANYLIGKTSWVDDQKQALDVIGMGKSDENRAKVRDLATGHFLRFGPAFGVSAATEFKVGKVKTTHPDVGVTFDTPAAPKSIAALVEELSGAVTENDPDRPATIEQAQQRIDELLSEIQVLRDRPVADVQDPMDSEAVQLAIANIRADHAREIQQVEQSYIDMVRGVWPKVRSLASEVEKMVDGLEVSDIAQNVVVQDAGEPPPRVSTPETMGKVARNSVPLVATKDGQKITSGMQMVLDSLLWWWYSGVKKPTVEQVAFAAGRKYTGTFSNYISACSTAGLLFRDQGTVEISDLGRRHARHDGRPASLAVLHDRILSCLKGRPREVMAAVLRKSDSRRPWIPIDDLASMLSVTHSGTFSNYVSTLSSAGFVIRKSGEVRAAEILYPKELL